MARRGRDNDGKYVRLTGLWPSKNKETLWTGKIRNQDLGKLLDKLDEADKDGKDVVVFLWENTDKSGRKDPDFTVQIAISEDQEGGRGSRGGYSSRGRDNDRDSDREEEEEEDKEEPEDKEEKPPHRAKVSDKDSGKSRSRSSGKDSGKRDKNDW